MVLSRRNTSLRRWDNRKSAVKDTSQLSKRAKNHAALQLRLWRNRQENGIFGKYKFKRRVLKNFFCSKTQLLFKTIRDKRKSKSFEPSDVTSSKTSIDRSNGAEETKLEMCKVSNSDCQSVSMAADFSTVHNNLNGAVSVNSEANNDCVCPEAEQNLTTDVVLTTETKAGDISIEIECPRQKISKNVQAYLCGFHQKYGSFIPLEKSDVLEHLKETFNKDLKNCEIMILEIIIEEMSKIVSTIPYFEVKYKKHRLTLDDLSTLASDNWLNDQVLNMYGELIMEFADSKVHFLNSFFHRQLMTKGYEGVKRWTKQVDLFSKHLLLVPVHLEVHWCLVTADFIKKTICLYDSQGIGLQKVARNIVKYLIKEAKEKKQSAFEMGWTVLLQEEIPQQTNENDCGVFVLEYSRCLALSEPLQFLQKDIPNIRKRIYKELCDSTLHKKS